MGFSRSAGGAKSGGGGFDAEAWGKWSEVLFGALRGKVSKLKNGKQRKQSTQVGVVNFIMDLGTPEGGEGFFESKCEAPEKGVDYSEEEIEAMRENPDLDFRWIKEWNNDKKQMEEVRRRVVPMQRAQEYGICVDFPNILVDYSQHPNAPEDAPEDLRPMRISLNGKFRGEIQKKITFEKHYATGEVKDTNLIRKIAKAADLDDELVESDFDIATVAGAVCNFKVTLDLTKTDDGKVFYNANATTPSAIEDIYVEGELIKDAKAIIEGASTNKHLAEFTGILLDMEMSEFTDEMMSMVGSDQWGFVKRAETSQVEEITGTYKEGHEKAGETWSFEKGFDYDSCNFKKAYEAWKKKNAKDDSKGKSDDDDDAAKKKKAAAAKAKKDADAKKAKAAEKANAEEEEEDTSVDHESQDDEMEEEEEGNGVEFDDDIPF